MDEPLENCGSCGADLGPSKDFPWHRPEEDCRSVREPVEEKFRAEIDTGEGAWYTNAMRFDTREEAETYARDLHARWTMSRQWRVVPDSTPMKEPVA